MNKEILKVYLSNGEEGELLTQYQDGNKTEYVVKVVIGENYYEGESNLIYENRIVSNIYRNYGDIPMYLRKTELENKVGELNENIKELTEQKTKLTKELKSIYNPQFTIGLPIYWTAYGNKIEELKIVRIVFTEQEDRSFYTYYCNQEYRNFEEIGNCDYLTGNCYYLTKEEAEKSHQKYLENKKIEDHKRIEENYKKAKEEYEKVKRE